jgi:hypothetical protein
MPPELLPTSGSGLIMYMLKSLRDQMGGGKDRDLIDKQHVLILNLIQRQSECDFLRGSMRNGLIDGMKCQSSEQKGNLFRLLCVAHTTNGSRVIKRSIKYSDTKWKQYIEFLKLYLCMEEWFHDSNNKLEVINAQPQIAKVLQSLQHIFQEIQTSMDTIFQRCLELLKCRSMCRNLEVDLTFMADLENQHTSNLLKYQDREHSKESVSLHSRLDFNTTTC